MTRIAVIGTAGRKTDAARLSYPIYLGMVDVVRQQLQSIPRPWDLVSGGAPYGDHCAVDLWLAGEVDSLTLWFPCAVWGSRGSVSYPNTDVGNTATYYHKNFSRVLQAAGRQSSFEDLSDADEKGAHFFHDDGFYARNLRVGVVDVVIAQTFGRGSVPADGGTAHTWRNSTAPLKIHIPIGELHKPAPAQQKLF